MYKQNFSSRFPRDIKKCEKKHREIALLHEAIRLVVSSDEKAIPHSFNDHALKQDRQGQRVLHLGGRNSDWLLLYEIQNNTVYFVRTGTHDDIL